MPAPIREEGNPLTAISAADLEFAMLSDAEFEQFALKHPQNSFLQSLDFARFQRARGQQVELFGVRRDGDLVAAGKLNYTTTRLGYTVCECAKGPLMDYMDWCAPSSNSSANAQRSGKPPSSGSHRTSGT
jgi:alanine adding enzyme